jgi:hypothetical protein
MLKMRQAGVKTHRNKMVTIYTSIMVKYGINVATLAQGQTQGSLQERTNKP